MHKERILRLADFLDNLPEKFWDFEKITGLTDDMWDGISYDDPEYYEKTLELTSSLKSRLQDELASKFTHSCGATACAVGWCPAVFSELEWSKTGIVKFAGTEEGGPDFSFGVVRELLDLTKEQMEIFEPYDSVYWCDWEDEITPKDVAEALRKLLENSDAVRA